MSVIGVTGAVVVGVAVGVGIGIAVTKSKQDNEEKREKETEFFRRSNSSDNSNAKSNVVTTEDSSIKHNIVVSRVVMRNEVNRFVDLLEPMYMVSNKQIVGSDAVTVFDEWNNRILNLENADKLIEKWELIVGNYKEATEEVLCSSAFRWINQLASYGISRDDRDEIQVNAEVVTSYKMPNQEELVMGDRMYVKVPAWYIDDNLLRHGVLVKEKLQ